MSAIDDVAAIAAEDARDLVVLEGMSRSLSKLSGGSVDDYATLLRIFPDETELLIARAERGDKLRHVLVPLQSTEAFDGFEHAGGDPA